MAQEDSACESCRAEDEVQAGAYTPPEVPQVQRPDLPDPRGKEIRLPIAGAPTLRHRAGAGLFVGEVGAGNNVFVKPGRDKVSVGMRRDF
jgi:hypothetical protein